MKLSTTLPILLLVAHPLAASDSSGPRAPDHGEQHASASHPEQADEHGASAPNSLAEEHASLLRIGQKKLDSGDAESAIIAYTEVARRPLNDQDGARALLGLARAYRLSGNGVKAAATYERLIKDNPAFAEIPTALLELGRTLRDLGSPKLAIARFYSVIHSTLKLPEAESERYRGIVRTAQFEIAETHLATGNYGEAARFFKRLDLLDLAPADRSRARFKAAQSLVYTGDKDAAVAALTTFIHQDPDDPHSPEARYLLTQLLSEMGRHEDSLRVTLDLLNHQKSRNENTEVWRSWQRRTGNQLANQFYQHGEFYSALLLYRALESLDPAPSWRVPVLYQLGLCQERLEQTGDAISTYSKIKDLVEKEPTPELQEISRMAAWRMDQISWTTSTRVQIIDLRPSTPKLTTNEP